MNADMKPTPLKIRIIVDEAVNGPSLSFSHLASTFDLMDMPDDDQSAAYGFPQSQEEDLYETGYLSKLFLRC